MTAYFGRRYKLSASHRLFCAEWDEARNLEAFGKCANPYGHGHNYVVEVLAGGAVDEVTGMVVDLVELDAWVACEVLEPFDHANLNLHPAFETRVPTSENFCIEIFDRLQKVMPAGLLRQVRVEETLNNSFTYTGKLAKPAGAVRKRL
jgi:6-pyruvoyltetrahydropterin/6-carboxytetrahydropterin synthase